MALVPIGGNGILYGYWTSGLPATPASGIPAFANVGTLAAAGEIISFTGNVWFAGGPGTAKTLSSSNGKIQFRTGAVTWGSAGSIIKIGIQDVSASAGPIARPDEDWTGEPVVSWTQGTNALSANTWTTCALTSGSRVLTHGDLISVVFDMTVRNGGDSVIVSALQLAAQEHRPVNAFKTGAAWGVPSTVSMPNVVIECDDGTLCSIEGSVPASTVTVRTIGTGSTPDEIGNIITIPFNCRTSGLWATVAPANDFEFNFYSAATGTPVEEQAVVIDPNQVLATGGRAIEVYMPPEDMTKSLAYAVTVRPTTASTVSVYEIAVNAAAHLAFWPGGTNIYKCSRSDDTGVFTPDTAARIIMGPKITYLDDGTTATAAQLKIGEIVNGVTGTYDGSDRWTSPAAGDYKLGAPDLKSNSTTTNLVGTLVSSGGVSAQIKTNIGKQR